MSEPVVDAGAEFPESLDSLITLDAAVLARERKLFEAAYRRTLPRSRISFSFLASRLTGVSSYVSWMVHPYGVSAALALFAIAVFVAFHDSVDQRTNALRGFYAAVLVYLVVAACQFRDSLLIRPHPVFWRLVKGLAFLYAFGLVWMLFQSRDDARQVLRFWEPSLGVPLAERSYAMNCDLYTPHDPESAFRHLRDAVLDVFLISHLIGWFCKMIMIRDVRLTLVASVIFEVYEISLTHMLPNFKECWWDTVLLDVVLANGLGIVAGYYALRFFNAQEYNFLYNLEGRWKPLVSFRYMLGALVVLASLALIELNAFFLKFILWVPPPHHLNFWRVVFWWLLGCAGLREMYFWMMNPGAPVGMMITLIYVCAVLETLLCYKYSTGLFPDAMDPTTKYVWIAVAVVFTLFCAVYYPLQHFRQLARNADKDAAGVAKAEGAPEIPISKRKAASKAQ